MFFTIQNEDHAVLNAVVIRYKHLHNQHHINRRELGEYEALARFLNKHPLVYDIGTCSEHGLQVFLNNEGANAEAIL